MKTGIVIKMSVLAATALCIAGACSNHFFESVKELAAARYGRAATPAFSPLPGTYNSDQSVTISCSTPGAVIHYSVDGTAPTFASPVFSAPIPVAGNGTTVTIKAFAASVDYGDSDAATGVFSINSSVAATPTFTPSGGTYSTDQAVTITCSTVGATIHYTTDGSTPTASSAVYSLPIPVAGNGTNLTIKAVAVKSGMLDSVVASGLYTINYSQVSTPNFAPPAATYGAPQSVTITTGTSGATIRYTTDGSTPTSSYGTVYSAAVPVNTGLTLKAVAYKGGMADSTMASAAYILQVAPPGFSPGAGTYSGAQSVTITTTTPGATIRYTTDGSTPTASYGTVYSGPVAVNGSLTLKAIAYEAGWSDSAVSTATYVLPVFAPSFAPAAGLYSSAQSVAISTTTPGATIRYTTDGSTPTASYGTVYSAPVTVNATLTLKALAYEAGWTDSTITSGAYTLRPAMPTASPSGGALLTASPITLNCATSGASIAYTTDGSIPTETAGTVTNGTLYMGPFSLPQGPYTVRAIAFLPGWSDSTYASAVYTVTGNMTTVAGTGVQGYTGDGGLATSATIKRPEGMAVDPAGNLYIADYDNNVVRKVDVAGTISTYAGTGVMGFSGDGGPATAAKINAPMGLAVDGAGNLFISDYGNSVIRKVTPGGTISTVAGSPGSHFYSGDGGPATSATIADPVDVAVDTVGNMYIASYSDYRVRMVNTSGIITTVAGNGMSGYSGDGGSATVAKMNTPFGVAVDASGNLYIADLNNHRIRKVSAGIITTFAGTGTGGFSGDGGLASSAQLSYPADVAVDPSGAVLIADQFNSRIRKVVGGVICTIAGNGTAGFADGPAISGSLNHPQAVAVSPTGVVYVADLDNYRIRKVY